MTWHHPADLSRKGPVPQIPGPSVQCMADRPPLDQVAISTGIGGFDFAAIRFAVLGGIEIPHV
jgi:hypothetical protein